MHKQIFVNLAVSDLKRSMAFFRGLGFEFNPQFTNEQGACMVIGENIHAMLLSTPFFKTFVTKPVLSSTGALRLEDVKGVGLLLQIANKSMLMDTRQGVRLVDACTHEKQRAFMAAQPK